MIRIAAGGIALCLCLPAWAQGLPAKPDLTLTVTEDEAKLIVGLLDEVGCTPAKNMKVCVKAIALQGKLQQQIIAEQPK